MNVPSSPTFYCRRDTFILALPEVLRRAFEEMTVLCDKQLQLLHLQDQNLRVARDLLLPRLMSGEIAA